MRTLFAAAFLAAGLVVAGCTSSTATVPPAKRSVAVDVCNRLHDVTSLVVTRIDVINKEAFGFPSTVHVDRAAQARAVAAGACALPRWPRGLLFCPDAWGPSYRLSFYDKGVLLSAVDATPTGCASVGSLVGKKAPAREATDRFWKVLGTAMGLRGATASTFAGTLA